MTKVEMVEPFIVHPSLNLRLLEITFLDTN